MTLPLLKSPSALLPIGLAVAALTLPWIALAVFGPDPTGDEGAAAHLYQLLMVLQGPIILFFALKWLPREPREALTVLALQGGAWCAALGTLFFFEKIVGAL